MADTLNDFEVSGTWRLPGATSTVPGTLIFSRRGGGELRLIGNLSGIWDNAERSTRDGVTRMVLTERTLEGSGRYPRIHGEADNACYTLDDCFRVRSTNNLVSGQGHETIRTNRVFKGAHFDDGEDVAGTSVEVSLSWLTPWVGETGISEVLRWSEDDQSVAKEADITVEARRKPDRQIALDNGAALSLKHTVTLSGDRLTARTVSQDFYWRVDVSDLTSIDDLLDLASDLQDLVSVATMKRAAFKRVLFWHPDVFVEHGDDRRQTPIELHAQWNVISDEGAPPSAVAEQSLFTFDQLDGIEGVRRWMNVAGVHRGALGRVMATRYAEDMFVSDRLLNCAAALEAFDRTRTGLSQSKFKTRLRRCTDLAGEIFPKLVGDVEKWAEAVRLERDDIAHHFGRRMKSSGSETLFLWMSLDWLFALSMLKEAAAPPAVFEHARQHRRYTWLQTRVQAVTGSTNTQP